MSKYIFVFLKKWLFSKVYIDQGFVKGKEFCIRSCDSTASQTSLREYFELSPKIN